MAVGRGGFRFTISTNRAQVLALRSKLGKIITQVPAKNNEDLGETAKSIKKQMQTIIRSNTRGSDRLASSLTTVNTINTKDRKAWRVFPADREAARYGVFLETGDFTEHWVKISDKPQLETWIRKNMPEVADQVIAKDRIRLGKTWAGRGLRFAERSFADHIGVPGIKIRENIQKALVQG